MLQQTQHVIQITHISAVSPARSTAKALARTLGFSEKDSEEVALVVSELASNLVKHAQGGTLTLTALTDRARVGIQLLAQDHGPGIADVAQALTDGFSTAGSLGYGLGTVNRLMDELEITAPLGQGTCIVCKRWVCQQGHQP